jgi:hypothetical protein
MMAGKGAVSTQKDDSTAKLKHKHFKWAPNLGDVYRSVEENAPGNDGWAVKEQMTR